MRKWNVWLLLLSLLLMLTAPGAYAEGFFSVAGYDEEATGHVWTENLFFERMEKLTGVELELRQYTTKAQWEKAKEAMLAGETALPDVLFKADISMQEAQRWYEAGKLIDLRPYLAEHAPNLWALLESHPEWLADIALPDGAIVTLPYIDELQFNNAMWINTNWLKRLNLATPTTAEELTEVLRAFRDNDLNGNGKKDDEIPLTFSTLWDLRFLQHAFGVNSNDYYLSMDENGRVFETLTTAENRAFIEWLKGLWDEGLLDLNGFTGLRGVAGNPDEETEVVYGVMFAPSPISLVHSSKVGQYALLEPLVYEGKQIYRDLTGDVIRGTFAITSACKDPAAMLRWVDFLYTEEGYILAAVGQAEEEFDWNDDGTWLWADTGETLLQVTLPQATLHDGSAMPGMASVSFQEKMDDQATQHVLMELKRLRGIDSLPMPLVCLTEAQQSRVDELIFTIGCYAEQQMVWFVAGDVPLNDETWADFCQQVKSLGMDEMVSIWQAGVDARPDGR